mmetsp:Transcript_9606/g.23580  ORF Transcript_9606/g.23580 Transcript_9606/m.23580 type:complete len:593 (+) Transcript_9606:281-2059(+)
MAAAWTSMPGPSHPDFEQLRPANEDEQSESSFDVSLSSDSEEQPVLAKSGSKKQETLLPITGSSQNATSSTAPKPLPPPVERVIIKDDVEVVHVDVDNDNIFDAREIPEPEDWFTNQGMEQQQQQNTTGAHFPVKKLDLVEDEEIDVEAEEKRAKELAEAEKVVPAELQGATISRSSLYRLSILPDKERDAWVAKNPYVRIKDRRPPPQTSGDVDKEAVNKYVLARIIRFDWLPEPYEVQLVRELPDGAYKRPDCVDAKMDTSVETRETTICVVCARGTQERTYKFGYISEDTKTLSTEFQSYVKWLSEERRQAAQYNDEEMPENAAENWGEQESEDCAHIKRAIQEINDFVFDEEAIRSMIDPSLAGNASMRLREAKEVVRSLGEQIAIRGHADCQELLKDYDKAVKREAEAKRACEESRMEFEEKADRMFRIAQINNRSRERQDYLDLTVAADAAGRVNADEEELDNEGEVELNPFARAPMNPRNMWDMSVRNKDSMQKLAARLNVRVDDLETDSVGKVYTKGNKPAGNGSTSPGARSPGGTKASARAAPEVAAANGRAQAAFFQEVLGLLKRPADAGVQPGNSTAKRQK